MARSESLRSSTVMDVYLAEINRCGLLTVEEERDLARRYQAGDNRAGHRLITANLRFVVKVAHEYRSYGFRMADLIQEGNIGLMKAVQKFDPEKGIRLISYAVWWIRAYIQNHILRSWSLVKLGTTQAQRKLFFSLARTRREIDRAASPGQAPSATSDAIAEKLRVKVEEVREMQQRMEGRDVSLDAPVGEEGSATYVDFVADGAAAQDETLGGEQEKRLLAAKIALALARLDARERFIIESRLMKEEPLTLKELGDHFGFSRERARQLEIRAREKLRAELEALGGEVELTARAPAADGLAAA